ncbi:hypothetical protein V2K69_17615 [Pseudomonas alliivorans]|nr:hypothetical protein [Pseudomonas alliivorans]MEE4722912.1 hypothetical protein [Pseudomonas alliivorans]MEE4759212.1 hypothetical protein [Pseudomonas alliivorans]MEE4763758.1 hypothetical protein [Pseudomonas alliivorans]MEE4774158.1 hypothetical protein [Pseudomonas alliivorans]
MADKAWSDEAYEIVIKVAKDKKEFTSDDIWAAGLQKPEEARALGGVMRKARIRGVIEKTGRSQCTTQPESHGADINIWMSKIYAGSAF